MDGNTKILNKKYDRVMPRVFNRSRSSLKSSSLVMRHDTQTSVRGAKPSVSNVSLSVYSDLPMVLNDYSPESGRERQAKRTFVVKPRKTIKSLNPALSPPRPVPRPVSRPRELSKKSPIRAGTSAPIVFTRAREKWSDSHVKQCYSSRSHSKLTELKEEIHAYHETEKLMKLRSHLYKSCGVVLDDVGHPAADKAIQVEDTDRGKNEAEEKDNIERSEQRSQREDAGAFVSDEQMRAGPPRYPVDRYLVESSNKFEMVNIIDDELWNSEPALRPEDEIILRKLHEMLQSTADDLKLLSGELSKFHTPGVQVKTAPTPLDEEFNEKVHIEDIVNAKFHGYKIIETQHVPENKPRNDAVGERKPVNNIQRPKIMNSAQMNTTITNRPSRNKNLGISRTRIIEIDDRSQESSKNEKLNNGKVYKAPTVAYNEFCYEHIESEVKETPRKLQLQDMPRINIRSELKAQKVLQLDIVPDKNDEKELNIAKSNVSVITILHENVKQNAPVVNVPELVLKKTVRKVSKMSTCDSSGSANNISSDAQVKLDTQKRIINSIRNSPKNSARNRNKKNGAIKNEQEKRPSLNLDEWKKKLNLVYGSTSKKTKTLPPKVSARKSSPKKKSSVKTLNNTEYIPYSQLTLGGVRVSDIEREISDIPNKNNIPLSPLLDKILSSRENSFRKESSWKNRLKDPQILTTSDENLLQEVIDIEKNVSETLSKNLLKKVNDSVIISPTVSNDENVNAKDNDSYADDFEDEKSDHSGITGVPLRSDNNISSPHSSLKSNQSDMDDISCNYAEISYKPGPSNPNQNTTYTKPNLSIKDSVDIFEFIHAVDMQDNATQSSALSRISPKETQTSPRTDRPNIQPTIHNDLWSLDPRREVEKMFELEKDFIKKLIIDEYGEFFEKNINKPTTSNENKEEENLKNVSALQKNTQTSPAHVKSVMTSPKRTKTRTTSPFNLSVPVHQQTSPMIFVTDDNHQTIDVADDISVNLSSPRFSLRLPQNSREVISNLEAHSRPSSKNITKDKLNYRTFRKTSVSSSSIDADNSSSELSSLGEVKMKKLRKRVPSISECSTSSKYSSDFQSMGILPLRSEGEVSFGKITTKRSGAIRNSEGETSFDPLL